MNLAVLLMHRGVTGRARSEFEQAVEATPRDPLPYWNYAAALIDVGKPEQARQELQRALAIDPDCGPAHAEMGRVEILADNNTTAVARFARAESLGVANPAMHANYGLALLRAGRPADAELQLERATREDSTRAATWNHLGWRGCARATSRMRSSRCAMRPGSNRATTTCASTWPRCSCVSSATMMPSWCCALRGRCAPICSRPGGWRCAHRGAPPKPCRCCARPRSARRATRRSSSTTGVLLAETGDVPAALDVWRRVLEIDPNNATARDNLAARGGTVPAPAK
jgi:Tfp pilus assembly protein PilF